MKERIENKINNGLSPKMLIVKNVSENHKGHVGWNKKGESHFEISISCSSFDNKSLLEKHKIIYQTLEKEMKLIHSLKINIK